MTQLSCAIALDSCTYITNIQHVYLPGSFFVVVDTVNTTLHRKKEIQTTMPRSVAAFQLSSHVAVVQYWRGHLATQDFSSYNLTKASAM